MIEAKILIAFYLAICLGRWIVGRHYGERLRFLGPFALRESWELLSELPEPWPDAIRWWAVVFVACVAISALS